MSVIQSFAKRLIRRHFGYLDSMKDVSNEKMKHEDGQPGNAQPDWSDAMPNSPLAQSQREKLEQGEVVIDVKETGTEKLVAGRILLDESVEAIWKILANPYEFSHGLYPRMHKVQILENEKEHSRMRCTIGLGAFLPDIVAVVDTDYIPGKRIDFRKVGGTLKDLSGGWTLTPREGGKTEVAYWMNIDPGIPVPGWVVRQGIKMELPNTLKAVRDRLQGKGKPAHEHILAAEI